ncbi:hypothetical protein [Pseudoxanthomonas mexicana]
MDQLARRLNAPGKDRIPAMWETAVFHGLAKCGALESEAALPSGRRPDVQLTVDQLHITADITAVSDDGLDDQNPFQELMWQIEAVKTKLGLPSGGLDLRVRHKVKRSRRGSRTVLRLPNRNALPDFIRTKISPLIRTGISANTFPLHITIEGDDAGVDITIDPSLTPTNTGSYAPYSLPQIRDQNPLYNALKAKAGQLRGAQGAKGIFVGDAGCDAMSFSRFSRGAVSPAEIVNEFFRQYSSIDFVVLMTVTQKLSPLMYHQAPELVNEISLFIRDGCTVGQELDRLVKGMAEHFPQPSMLPINGSHRAREPGYSLGFHGGFEMSGDKVRMSLREFTEVLAGLRTLADQGAKVVPAPRALSDRPNPVQSVISANLARGWLPIALDVVKGGEDENDDWVEIVFGGPDPAISPLC